MVKQQDLFQISPIPILEVLHPVRIEQWRADGLFKKGLFSVHEKVVFIGRIRALAFDSSHKISIKSEQSGMSREMIMVEKRDEARRKFDYVSDPVMREIMVGMIVREDLLGARYVARKLKYPWPQFVIDFNYGLEQMMRELCQ